MKQVPGSLLHLQQASAQSKSVLAQTRKGSYEAERMEQTQKDAYHLEQAKHAWEQYAEPQQTSRTRQQRNE